MGCINSPAGVIKPAGPCEEMMAASVVEEAMLLSDIGFYQTVSNVPMALKMYPADCGKTYSVEMIL